jgi:hypothetical protein
MRKLFALVFLMSFGLFVNAQQVIRCYTEEVKAQLISTNPNLQNIINAEKLKARQNLNANSSSGSRAVITIPVVVHVIHDGDPVGSSENISDAQILSQIEVLNNDYRRMNADTTNTPSAFASVAADVEIEFCLAQRDPDGNPATGIVRHNYGLSAYSDNDMFNTVMPQTIWNRNNYLNIYVARLGGSASDLLGFSAVPGYPPGYDGVVIGYRYFGNVGNVSSPYNKGRTTTHEIGHWLGLDHIWGIFGGCNDDDGIADTPESDAPYYGCPSHPQSSCGSDDMFMNFMDYSNDACMNIFTQGQKASMLATINANRNSLLISNGCSPVPINQLDIALVNIIYPNTTACENPLTPVIEIKNIGSDAVTSFYIQYQINGGTLQQYQWTGNLAFSETAIVTMPPVNFTSGSNTFFVLLSLPNNSTDDNTANNEQTTIFSLTNPVSSIIIPFLEDFESGQFPQQGWALQNTNNDRTWELANFGAYGTSSQCMYFDNFSGTSGSNPGGTKDALVTLPFNLSGNLYSQLTFDVAYARRNIISSDSLIVSASFDCGLNWNRLYARGGNSLATAAITAAMFEPSDTTWRKDTVSLSGYVYFPAVRLKFENKSGWGNNIYVDNINIEYLPASVAEKNPAFNIQLYPNPNNGLFNIDVAAEKPGAFTLQVFDIMGKEIFVEQLPHSNGFQKQLNLTNFGSGIYLVKVSQQGSALFRRVVVH